MASGSDTHQVVAVLNTSPDTVDLLKDVFERAGFLVASAYTHDIRSGVLDVEAFLRVHRPAAIVYDIAPPYERNWAYLQHLRSTALSTRCTRRPSANDGSGCTPAAIASTKSFAWWVKPCS